MKEWFKKYELKLAYTVIILALLVAAGVFIANTGILVFLAVVGFILATSSIYWATFVILRYLE